MSSQNERFFFMVKEVMSQRDSLIDICKGKESMFTPQDSTEEVDHPIHYGGADDPYEAIKVIEAWHLGFHLGNTVKYISRSGAKGDALTDLKKAAWYLNREIRLREGEL